LRKISPNTLKKSVKK